MNKTSLIAILAATLLAASASAQVTINVPADQPTITAAIAAANPAGGDTIQVTGGPYAENPVVDRRVDIIGVGMMPPQIQGTLTVAASGLSAAMPLLIQNLELTGAGNGLQVSSMQSFLRFQDLRCNNNASAGARFNPASGNPITDVEFVDCQFDGNVTGFIGSSTAHLERFTFTNCEFRLNLIGCAVSGTNNVNDAMTIDWTFTNCLFEGNNMDDSVNSGGGLWLRTAGPGVGSVITNVLIDGCTFRDNGSSNVFNQFGVSVVQRPMTLITGIVIQNCLFEDTPALGTQTQGVHVEPQPATDPIAPVMVLNNTFRDLQVGVNAIPQWASLSGNTFDNVTSPIVSPAGGLFVGGIALADDDGDLDLDIFTSITFDNMGLPTDAISVLVNDGDGVFAGLPSLIPLAPGSQPGVLATGRTLGGFQVAALCPGSHELCFVEAGSHVVSTVGLPMALQGPSSLVANDLDGDGIDDFVVGFAGDTLGNFPGVGLVIGGTASVLDATMGQVQGVTTGDFDGDGNVDIAATVNSPDEIRIYLGLGGGAFGPPMPLPLGLPPVGIDAFDMGGDGDLDLLVTFLNGVGNTDLVVFDNGGAGTFTAGNTVTTPGSTLIVRGVDFSDDSVPGFIPDSDAFTVGLSNVAYRHVDYDPVTDTFGALVANPLFNAVTGTDVGDLNGDGTPDVVFSSGGLAVVALGTTPSLAQQYGTSCPGSAGPLTLSGAGVPSIGTPSYQIDLTGAAPFAGGFLLASIELETLNLGAPGCDLLVGQPFDFFQFFTGPLGSQSFNFPLLPPSLLGVDLFLQAVVFDGGATTLPGVSLSNGLRLQFGE